MPKALKPFPASATSKIPNVATSTPNISRDVVRSLMTKGDRMASMMGLVFTKKVALAIVVSLTAKINAARCKLRKTPEAATSVKSRFPSSRKLRVANPIRIMTSAAMASLKNVSEIAEASVANLIRIALEAKKNEPTTSATIPLDANGLRTPTREAQT